MSTCGSSQAWRENRNDSENRGSSVKGQGRPPETPAALPLRVLHLVSSLDVGGQERVILDLARHASPGEIEPRVATIMAGQAMMPEFRKAGIPVACLCDGPVSFGTRVLRLRELVQHDAIDVVHCHNPAPAILGALLRATGRRVRLVLTRHGRNEMEGHWHRLLLAWATSRMDAVVAVSADSADVARTTMTIDSAKLTVINNGIDTSLYGPSDTWRTGTFRAITVARLDPLKGLHYMLNALPRIVGIHPQFTWTIVGDGPERARLEREADLLGVGKHVRFLGTRGDVPTLLREAHLFVLPSLSEGVSISILEAMASGLPVIATNVGGTPELITDGVTGTLVPAGDVESLVTATAAVVARPALAAALAIRGRQHVVSQFDVREMVSRYESLYRRTVPVPMGTP